MPAFGTFLVLIAPFWSLGRLWVARRRSSHCEASAVYADCMIWSPARKGRSTMWHTPSTIDVHFASNRPPMSRRKAIDGRKLSANHRASSELALHKN
jgi:hypothetical protein